MSLRGQVDDGIAVERRLKLGARQGDAFVVQSGKLRSGEWVVIRSNERLSEGEAVKVVEPVAGDSLE